jgi:hypothetical protein
MGRLIPSGGGMVFNRIFGYFQTNKGITAKSYLRA